MLKTLFNISMTIFSISMLALLVLVVSFVIKKIRKKDTDKTKKLLKYTAIVFGATLLLSAITVDENDPIIANQEKEREARKIKKQEKKEKEEQAKQEAKAKREAEAKAKKEKKEKEKQEAKAKKEAEAKKKAEDKKKKEEAKKKEKEPSIEEKIEKILGNSFLSVEKKVNDHYVVEAEYSGLKKASHFGVANLLKDIQDEDFKSIDIIYHGKLVDKYGNEEEAKILTYDFKKETVDKINFKSFNKNNTPEIADNYWEHPAAKND